MLFGHNLGSRFTIVEFSHRCLISMIVSPLPRPLQGMSTRRVKGVFVSPKRGLNCWKYVFGVPHLKPLYSQNDVITCNDITTISQRYHNGIRAISQRYHNDITTMAQ